MFRPPLPPARVGLRLPCKAWTIDGVLHTAFSAVGMGAPDVSATRPCRRELDAMAAPVYAYMDAMEQRIQGFKLSVASQEVRAILKLGASI